MCAAKVVRAVGYISAQQTLKIISWPAQRELESSESAKSESEEKKKEQLQG